LFEHKSVFSELLLSAFTADRLSRSADSAGLIPTIDTRIPNKLRGIKRSEVGIVISVGQDMNSTKTSVVRIDLSSGPAAIKQALTDELRKAIDVIYQLDDLTYCRDSRLSSSVGEQFRHDLDFVNTFLNGIQLGRVDYTRRERDVHVSRSRSYAIDKFERAARRVELIRPQQLSGLVSVRSEVDGSIWLPSSVAREIEFVLSHTIHHHALIAEKLEVQGISLDAELGVAPSTKDYRSRFAA
jgi:hypothetical protein